MTGEHRNGAPIRRDRVVASVALACALAGGCAWHEPVAPVTTAPRASDRPVAEARVHDARIEHAVATALDQLGAPYRYGGASPAGFDCSGLVTFAYAAAGARLPRTTRALWRDVRRVGTTSPRRGDLVFFRIGGKLGHVGLFVGDGRFVHAPSAGSMVRIDRLDAPYYSARFAGVGRPLD